MTKLGKDLQPGDRLSLTGDKIEVVQIEGDRVSISYRHGLKSKVFSRSQTVYLQS